MNNTVNEKVTNIEERVQKLINQKKMLIQKHKEYERKNRTHRLCKRGGMLESVQPETLNLTDEQLKTLLEKVLTSDFARNRIAEMQKECKSPSKPAPAQTTPVVDEDSDEDI